MLFLVRGKVGISVPFKHHDFLFPMDKTFLLLFLSLCLIFMLVGSSMAKLMMATLPPTQARTCYRITSQFLSVGRLENSRESTKANTTKFYLRKFVANPTDMAGLGNRLCSNKHQSLDCAATRRVIKYVSQRVLITRD